MTILQVQGSLDEDHDGAERLDDDNHLPGTLAKISEVQRALEYDAHVPGALHVAAGAGKPWTRL